MGSELTQDRWLRFRDPASEKAFHCERQSSALPRIRWAVLSFALIVALLGVSEWLIEGQTPRDVVARLLTVRFGFIVPLWLLYLGASFTPWFQRRMEQVSAICIVLSSWAFNYLVWEVVRALPKVDLSEALMTTSLTTLVAGVLLLPLRLPVQVGVTLAATAVPALVFATTLPQARPGQIGTGLLNLGATALALLVVGWWREAGERRSFAQRVALATANVELDRLNRAQADFLAIAAHDLRAPLAAVRGMADLLASGRLSAEQSAAAAADISGHAQRMLALVTSYLEEQSAREGRVQVTLQDLSAAPVLAAARARHSGPAVAKGLTLALAAGLPDLTVRADPALLDQVLDQFVGNALKFCPAGAAISLGLTPAGERRVRLSVRDTGPGLEEGECARLFQRFQRARAQPTAGESSFGLGLAIARQLAEAMGGTVGCTSEPGAGACFWIELPAP